MERRRGFALLLVCALIGNTFAVPIDLQKRAVGDNELDSVVTTSDLLVKSTSQLDEQLSLQPPPTEVIKEIFGKPPAPDDSISKSGGSTLSPFDDDDDDDDIYQPSSPPSGGSNVFSLLKLAGALFPGSSGVSEIIRNAIRQYLIKYQVTPKIEPNKRIIRRNGVEDNVIDKDYPDFKPPPPTPKQNITEKKPTKSEKQEIEENDNSEVEDNENSESESNSEEENDNAAEASLEDNGTKGSDENNSDYDDEPPGGGDGQGGGILGLLAGLSGGEEGSDLGSLLAAVGGIVGNLSGDGVDLNALIASGLGLFVGLLSEGNENPGSVIASYLLTSLDTITGGGSKNNGAFFGSFLSKLIKGISAAVDEDENSEEEGGNGGMKDSAGFVLSFIMGLLGDMSKGSSSGSSKPWDRVFTVTE